MRVLICGGRDFTNEAWVCRILDNLNKSRIVEAVIEGGATGADLFAKRWAERNGIECVHYSADWSRYGRAAGPMRNAAMLKEEPDMVVAFPGGKGTADMVTKAKLAGVQTIEMQSPPADLVEQQA